MKNNKIYLIFIILLGILLTLFNTVNASTSFNLALKSEKTSYSKGDTVTVNIDLTNVADESGIAAFQTKLSYDTDVLTLDSVKSENWEVMEKEGGIVANTKDALGTNTGTVAVVTFIVNENTTANSTIVKMSNVKGTTGDLVSVEGTFSELKIRIADENSSNSGTNNNATNNNGTSNNGTSNNGTNNNGTNNNGTTNNGTTNNGTNNNGTNNNGTSNNGTNNNGTNNNGTNNNGTNNNGASNNGTNNNGASNNGTNNNGTSNNGTTNNGTASNGTTNNGTSNNGITNNKLNTSTTQKIPYAGSESIIGITLVIALIGSICYIRYRKTL